uniref:Uncharacterized protein n=1 Tax=Anas platyrhynchos platyrhynchos TaxID=8840 RepID=A0A493T170_ANAPP
LRAGGSPSTSLLASRGLSCWLPDFPVPASQGCGEVLTPTWIHAFPKSSLRNARLLSSLQLWRMPGAEKSLKWESPFLPVL